MYAHVFAWLSPRSVLDAVRNDVQVQGAEDSRKYASFEVGSYESQWERIFLLEPGPVESDDGSVEGVAPFIGRKRTALIRHTNP
jgi:hypothetical protein